MEQMVAIVIIVIQLVMAVLLWNKERLSFRAVAASAVLIACDICCGGDMAYRLVMDMLLTIMSMTVLTSSLFSQEDKGPVVHIIIFAEVLVGSYYMLCAAGILEMMPEKVFMCVLDFVASVYFIGFIWTIWLRIRVIKAVMKSGTVWSFVCLCVDAVYVVSAAVILYLMSMADALLFSRTCIHVWISAVLLAAQSVAMSVRILTDSAFVFMREHERIIVESMKISRGESVTADAETNEMYRDIYERVLVYFEVSKPYLNGDLNINDVVKVVYSNKVYISRAICHYTGRNFRQFVNYYRIMYSLDAFRTKPDMKVSELAESSGFNTVVSYTMAFRLFMNETPSEWCRKERSKLIKKKK